MRLKWSLTLSWLRGCLCLERGGDVVVQAAKMLSFTEEEFSKTLELG